MVFSFCYLFPRTDAMPVVTIHLVYARPRFHCLHPGQPDGSQSPGYFFWNEFLVLLPAKKFLHQEEIHHHAQESAGGKQRIHVTKSSLPNSLPDVLRQRFVIDGDVSAKKTLRQRVILQSSKPQQP